MLSNISMASDALETSLGMCDSDPLVYNELGVVAYMRGE
jgi:anaphase-promoting complex subunit 6